MTYPRFRRIDRSTAYVRDDSPGNYSIRVTDATDRTPQHSLGSGYDSRCGYCYLNGAHSAAFHAASIARTQYPPFK